MVRVIVCCFFLVAACAFAVDLSPAAEERVRPVQQPPAPRPAASSNVNGTAAAEKIKLLHQKIAERDRLQTEIDELRAITRTPQQILVSIRVIEVSLSKLRRLGIDFATDGGQQTLASSMAQLVDPREEKKTFAFAIIPPGDSFHGIVEALEKQKIAKVLAEPRLVAVSGRRASFMTGGEFPLPSKEKSDGAVEFRKFGTQAEMSATLLGNDKVRMDLRLTIGEPDYSRTITIEGQKVPSFSVRQCDTNLELALGHSAVLSGFVERRVETVKRSDGQLREDVNEIETLFIVTPTTFDESDMARANIDSAKLK